jgi:hypothetical protein
MYMTLEGIFGVAVDVASSLIILFTIYGAFLQYSAPASSILDFSFRRWAASRPAPAAPWCWRRSSSAALRLGRGDDGDARRGGLSAAREGGLREERRGGLLAPAAWARSFRRRARRRRLPDRRVS